VLNGRAKLTRRLAVGASISALAVTLGVQSVSHAEPSLDEVEQRVGDLYHEAEVAQERLNEIRHQMQGKRDRLKSMRSDLKSQRAEVERIGDVVAGAVAQDAQGGGGFGSTSELLVSDNPDEIINGIVATESFTQHQGVLLAEFATKSDRLELREQQVEAEVAELERDREQVAKENDKVESKLAEAKEVLAELKAEERERLRIAHSQSASRDSEREPIGNVPVSGRAGAAVEFAMAQVGEAYVYGAAGPDSWDCSGLTMQAWAQAGVSLPHSSSGQMSSGTPVSRDQLQPGDLVFYYQPVSHVGMYIGNGQLVHAANPSTGVDVTSVDSMPYSGAVRPG
jgi:peptidoglycan DL-endopeptidase CwlO